MLLKRGEEEERRGGGRRKGRGGRDGGGIPLFERMNSPKIRKKIPLVLGEEEEEDEREGGFMVLVYDLQGEPTMFLGMLMTSS